jgi:hypothetical protein
MNNTAAEFIEEIDNIPAVDDIRYITPDKAEFRRTPGGLVSLSIRPDEKYPRVNLHRAFPHKESRKYISVRNTEGKEIGIIRCIDDFPENEVKIMEEELDRRYFMPVIKKINSLKAEFGFTYWDVETDSGPKRFSVNGGHSSVLSITESRLLVLDTDGNRYQIEDYLKFDAKSLKLVEPMI